MHRAALSLLLLAAICIAPASSQAAPNTFAYNYFLGMINPKSWDGPYWWGLRTDVEALVVSHVEGREIRSDRAGYAALAVTLTLVNTGGHTAGKSALVLSATEPQPYYPWWPDRTRVVVLDPEPEPWIVGSETRWPTLAPGQSMEVSTVVYRSEREERAPGEAAPAISLQISAP